MNADTIARIIQLVVVPVVMVTACAILAGGLLQRYAVINERLRALSRERFDLVNSDQVASTNTPRLKERLEQIDFQVPLLVRRHHQAHHAVLAVYCAVGVLIVDILLLALAVITNTKWSAILVLVVFFVGVLIMLLGILFTAVEVWSSHQAVEYEVNRVMKLPKSF